MSSKVPLLRLEDLAIHLSRGEERTPLVHAASWDVAPGETLAVVGESGSGKSLTALAVMGLLAEELTVAGGHIFYGHPGSTVTQDLTDLDEGAMRRLRGREIAMIFQEPMTSLNPVKSIGKQLTEAMRLNLGYSAKAAKARAIDLLNEVGISDGPRRLQQYPHQLSGGMRQRVMIAMALACHPKLILADEPTTALDVTIQAQILELTAGLCREHGVGLVLITHNLGIVARHARRVVVMYSGRVVEEALAEDLYRAPLHPYTQGLLQSVPTMTLARDHKLEPIRGAPPDPFERIEGCRFHPRCGAATAKCVQRVPPLEPVPEKCGRFSDKDRLKIKGIERGGDRSVACWHAGFPSSERAVSDAEAATP